MTGTTPSQLLKEQEPFPAKTTKLASYNSVYMYEVVVTKYNFHAKVQPHRWKCKVPVMFAKNEQLPMDLNVYSEYM